MNVPVAVAETRAGVPLVGVATVPVHDAPMAQQAMFWEESVEQVADAGQHAPPYAALSVEHEL